MKISKTENDEGIVTISFCLNGEVYASSAKIEDFDKLVKMFKISYEKAHH